MAGSLGAALGLTRQGARAPGPLATVVVSLKTEATIKGVLTERTSDALVLRAASKATVGANGRIEWQPLAGDIVVPMENVDYWQAGVEPAVVVED